MTEPRNRPQAVIPWVLGLWLLISGVVPARADAPLIVEVVPQYTPEHTFATWRPVLDRIELRTGVKLDLRIKASIPQFESAFESGEPDVAYMNPYHALMAHRTQGYLPIIRDGLKRLTGILVVPADASISSIDELDGKTVAFPAPNAFGASLYMRALLAREGVAITPAYVKTHSNVYRHVMLERSSAGGGVKRTLDVEPDGIRRRLRILYTTPPATPHPIVVHPRVPAALRQSLQTAFLDMGKSPQEHGLLEAISLPSPVSALLEDYKDLNDLNLDRFVERAGP